jgi:hypothetical protein
MPARRPTAPDTRSPGEDAYRDHVLRVRHILRRDREERRLASLAIREALVERGRP